MVTISPRRQHTLAGILILALLGGLATRGTAAPQAAGITMAPGIILGWYGAPRTAMAGDVNADGRADFVGYYPGDEGIIDLTRTSTLGKPCFAVQANTQAGKGALAVLTGPFADRRATVLLLLPDGALRLVHDLNPEATAFRRVDPVGAVPAALVPKAPVRACALDVDADGRQDALLIDSGGRLLLLHNRPASQGLPQFEVHLVRAGSLKVRRLAGGDLDGDGRAEAVWLDGKGRVFRAALRAEGGDWQLANPARLATASPDDGLACGRFRGEREADVIVGRRLLPGGDATRALELPTLPPPEKARTDYAWIAADFDGDGRDDLVRAQRSGDKLDGDHVYLHYACSGDPVESAPFADADNDGLLNAWERGAVKPGGLDLPALGCSPRHRDILVEVQRFADVPDDRVRAEMDRVVAYFAGLPIANPDGKPGIALHVLYLDPVPMDQAGKPWWDLGELYHARSHRGITHWMVVYNAGGGQSSEMADRGSCGVHGLYATFIHEFGHQLGLDHTGRWGPAWCPIYPSLMNYAYNYQLNGRGENIRYSDGRLASLVLDERRLSERLPLPMDDVSFLAGPPYRYRMKPAPGGKATLIDWNWNGIFGEKRVAADINYGYSTTAGNRHTIGKTYTAPALVAHGRGRNARLLLFCGRLPDGAPLPRADATAERPSLCAEQPGKLCLRIWTGRDPETEGAKWSDEVAVEAAGVTGDPSALYFQGATWVAYPMAAGVRIRRVTLAGRSALKFGAATDVPDTAGAAPTLASLGGRLALLLWRGPQASVELRLLRAGRNDTLHIDSVQSLGFASTVPVGAAEGAPVAGRASLWVGVMQDVPGGFPSRWQVRHFALERGDRVHQLSLEWVGGEKGGERGSSRVILLWEPNRALGPDGQVYFLACGLFSPNVPWSCHYVATRIADKSVNGGWLTRRYYDEWTTSRSAPGACFFRGDIAFAARWFGNVRGTEDNNLFVAFFGRGIESAPMGDFDDIALLRDYGLARSIPCVAE